MHRTLAIIERELRRFRRNPTMIILSMLLPVVQLCILGNAIGGNVRNLKVGVVDQDHGLPAVKLRELAGAVRAGSRTFSTVEYSDPGQALTDLRNGRIHAVVMIPPDFSRRVYQRNQPRLALIEDNTDNFVSATMIGQMSSLLTAFNHPAPAARIAGEAAIEVVEVYPFVPYVQYLLPGSIVMSIFTMVMIGGGINFVDDKARGLHEGYLVTPVTRFELIAGFNTAGTIKAVMSGTALVLVGSVIAGVPNPFDPLRLMKLVVVVLVTAFALISLMFLLMVRTSNPMVPRAMFGVLSTVLYFPSGAVYPQQGFPPWLRAIAVVDPFTYAVHALRSLLLKDTGFAAIGGDLLYLIVFSVIAMTAATLLFRRTL
ncbi:MAG: type transport system permease protein [Acidobacteriota bacterium]|nr:type transport system permease protein [Acidobacteriota bacterium]